MKVWCTEFKALDARTGEMKVWSGNYVVAQTKELAQQWCYENAGHLIVTEELVDNVLSPDHLLSWMNNN